MKSWPDWIRVNSSTITELGVGKNRASSAPVRTRISHTARMNSGEAMAAKVSERSSRISGDGALSPLARMWTRDPGASHGHAITSSRSNVQMSRLILPNAGSAFRS